MIKIALLYFCLLQKTLWAATDSLILELGEEQTLKGSVQKVWIENQKVLSAQANGSYVSVKGLSLGSTTLRQNSDLRKIVVVPSGSKKTYQDWERLSKKFIGLQVGVCEDLICLKGKVFRFSDLERILKLMDENDSSLYFSLDLAEDVKGKWAAWLESYFRDHGMTPLKVIYGSPWRVQYNAKETAGDYKSTLRKVGIFSTENKQKIEIADNVRVEIKIAEVKKDFGQILGLKWPAAYEAMVVDGKTAGINGNFSAALNAYEAQGDIRFLATPNLLCRSGKEAEFFAGGEIPIKILNYKFQDIVWKKYGIILKVKPVVDSIGQMSLQIETEVSSIDPSRSVGDIPAMLTNRVSSHFDLIQSKTIALSGLIKNENSSNSEGLPFLSRVPILGSLFSSKTFKENKSELVIFVTPELMRNE